MVVHENIHLSGGNYETRSSKIANENMTCRMEFEKSYTYLQFVATCSEIARTSVKVRETKLLPLVLLQG